METKEKSRFRWLHLCDIHYGVPGKHAEQSEACAQLIDHVLERRRCGLIPDLVFVTGDITHAGKAEQFQHVQEMLFTPLREALGPQWTGRIITVPGNHDLDREAIDFEATRRSAYRKALAPLPHADPRLTKRFATMRSAFTHFVAWDKREHADDKVHWLEGTEGIKTFQPLPVEMPWLWVMQLNTAWLAWGEDAYEEQDERALSYGETLCAIKARKIPENAICFVLGHHPISWLDHGCSRYLRSFLGKRNAFYLHGHMHAVRANTGETFETYMAVQGGATFQMYEDEQLPNSVTWGQVDLASGTIGLYPVIRSDYDWKRERTITGFSSKPDWDERNLWPEAAYLAPFKQDHVIPPAPGLFECAPAIIRTTIPGSTQRPESTHHNPHLPPGNLTSLYFREAAAALRDLDIFNLRSYRSHLTDLYRDLQDVDGSIGFPLLIEAGTLALNHSGRLGIADSDEVITRHLAGPVPLEFGVTFGQAGTLAILHYLKNVKQYNIHVNLKHQHTVELSEKALALEGKSVPDLVSLCLAPAAKLLGASKEYLPLMLQPPITFDIVSPKAAKESSAPFPRGEVLLVRGPSTSEYFLKKMLSVGAIEPRSVSLLDSSISEISAAMATENRGQHAVLWFPFTQLIGQPSLGAGLTGPGWISRKQKVVLFARRSLLANREKTLALVIAIRNAWLELMFNPAVLEHVVSLIAFNDDYLRLLARYGGFFGARSSRFTNPGSLHDLHMPP